MSSWKSSLRDFLRLRMGCLDKGEPGCSPALPTARSREQGAPGAPLGAGKSRQIWPFGNSAPGSTAWKTFRDLPGAPLDRECREQQHSLFGKAPESLGLSRPCPARSGGDSPGPPAPLPSFPTPSRQPRPVLPKFSQPTALWHLGIEERPGPGHSHFTGHLWNAADRECPARPSQGAAGETPERGLGTDRTPSGSFPGNERGSELGFPGIPGQPGAPQSNSSPTSASRSPAAPAPVWGCFGRRRGAAAPGSGDTGMDSLLPAERPGEIPGC